MAEGAEGIEQLTEEQCEGPMVPAKVLADFLKTTENNVRVLASQKRLLHFSGGRFPLRENVHLRLQMLERRGSELTARKQRAETELAELKLAKEAGQVIAVQDCAKILERCFSLIAQAIGSLPPRVNADGTLDRAQYARLEAGCREVLEDLHAVILQETNRWPQGLETEAGREKARPKKRRSKP
jgi:hypothetical protein